MKNYNPNNVSIMVTKFLQMVEDTTLLREGLQETPDRVAEAWKEILSGYDQNPEDIIKTFDNPAPSNSEMILLKNHTFYSVCEHHLLPFFGKMYIAYIPNIDGEKKVIGISKLVRIAEIFSRRLQIQERLGDQITECLMQQLSPLGAACVIEAEHLCMKMRGVKQQDATMMTSSLKGVFLKPEVRTEFFSLIK